MSTRRLAETCVRLIAGCSLALLAAAGSGAFAHGSHSGSSHVANSNNHFGTSGHGRCIDCGAAKWNGGGKWDGHKRHHHRHHHPMMAGSRPPLHGPGSSHNPIVYHPVHGPGSSHNPIVAKPGNSLAPGTVVRDHRNGKDCSYVVGAGGVISSSSCPHGPPLPPCSRTRTRGCIPAIPPGATVRDHRTSSAPPQCYGDLC